MGCEKLVLEGYKYQGRFKIEQKSHTSSDYIDGGYAGARWGSTTHKYFRGKATIINKQNNDEQKFIICPEGQGESHLILLGEDREEIMNRVQDHKGIIDLALQSMYENAKNSKEIIPEIIPSALNIEDLVELGLLSEEFGQMRLALSA